jgi:hypothetical protein
MVGGAGGKGESMKDEQRKLLTEKLLGECWHKFKGDFGPYQTTCVECQLVFGAVHFSDWNLAAFHRTFATWPDLGAVMEALVKQEKWIDFVQFCEPRWLSPRMDSELKKSMLHTGKSITVIIRETHAEFYVWLFRPTDENGEPHFCRLVAEWMEGEK